VPTVRNRAEVWGSPIGHSLSPTLHRVAYDALGLAWEYESRQVDETTLADSFAARVDNLVGLSLTMPLKQDILAVVSSQDPVVTRLGVANTVVFTDEGPTLFSTDPWGVSGAMRDHGLHPQRALVLGAGATARAIGCGLSLLGTSDIGLLVRSPPRAEPTARVLRELGLHVTVFDMADGVPEGVWDVVASTVPGGEAVDFRATPELLANSALFDVSYHPWPSPLASQWERSSNPIISGLWMLVHQALIQVRLFVHQDALHPLANEDAVLEAMKISLGLVPDPASPVPMG